MDKQDTSSGMQLAGNIFQEIVMEEAIKDKTAIVQKEMEDAEALIAAGQKEVQDGEEEENDSDSDFDDDDEILRTLRDKRMVAMKIAQQQKIEDIAKGHGKYQEIDEQ